MSTPNNGLIQVELASKDPQLYPDAPVSEQRRQELLVIYGVSQAQPKATGVSEARIKEILATTGM